MTPLDLDATIQSILSFIYRLHLPFIFSIFGLVTLLELIWGAERGQSLTSRFFNIRYTVLYIAIAVAVKPAIGYGCAYVVRALGGGLFTIKFDFELNSINRALTTITYILILDFFLYWFHRGQHSIPFFWSQHKLHHSDTSLNVTTAFRHHWLEEPLRGLFALIPMGIIFNISPVTGGIFGLLFSLNGYFTHSNIRLRIPWIAGIFVGPQVHRIHHSKLMVHTDKNFGGFFTIYDRIFGTYFAPAPDEYPPTGLHSGETTNSIIEASIWPFREWMGVINPESKTIMKNKKIVPVRS